MISYYLGIDSDYVIIGLAAVAVVLLILVICTMAQLGGLKKKYKKFMSGKDAKSLEDALAKRMNEIDHLIEASDRSEKDIAEIFRSLDHTYQKMGMVKYDAFKEMGGKLSFSLAMLDVKDNGFIISAMHTREGCYTYIKEIVDGNSVLVLSEEERDALDRAKNPQKPREE